MGITVTVGLSHSIIFTGNKLRSFSVALIIKPSTSYTTHPYFLPAIFDDFINIRNIKKNCIHMTNATPVISLVFIEGSKQYQYPFPNRVTFDCEDYRIDATVYENENDSDTKGAIECR